MPEEVRTWRRKAAGRNNKLTSWKSLLLAHAHAAHLDQTQGWGMRARCVNDQLIRRWVAAIAQNADGISKIAFKLSSATRNIMRGQRPEAPYFP